MIKCSTHICKDIAIVYETRFRGVRIYFCGKCYMNKETKKTINQGECNDVGVS